MKYKIGDKFRLQGIDEVNMICQIKPYKCMFIGTDSGNRFSDDGIVKVEKVAEITEYELRRMANYRSATLVSRGRKKSLMDDVKPTEKIKPQKIKPKFADFWGTKGGY